MLRVQKDGQKGAHYQLVLALAEVADPLRHQPVGAQYVSRQAEVLLGVKVATAGVVRLDDVCRDHVALLPIQVDDERRNP